MYNAVKSHDYATFTKFADIDTIVSNVLDKALAQSQKEQAAKTSGDQWEQLGANFAQGLITAFKPALIQKAKDEVKKQVEEGTFQTSYKPGNMITGFFSIKVQKDGKVANVTVPTQDPKTKPLSLKMRQQNGYWQVFDMNIDLSNAMESPQVTQTTTRVKLGTRTDIGGGWFIAIASPSAYVSNNEFETPKEGNRFVATEITYENTTDQSDTYSLSHLSLKDTDDHSFSYSYMGGKEPQLSNDTLEAKGKVKGFVTFEIPETAQIKSIIYNGTEKTIIFEK